VDEKKSLVHLINSVKDVRSIRGEASTREFREASRHKEREGRTRRRKGKGAQNGSGGLMMRGSQGKN